MTSVNVTAPVTKVTVDGSTSVVTATTAGPQGIQGLQGPSGGIQVNESAKVSNSVIYYDSSAGEFKADATTTKLSLVEGGNF